LLKLLHLVFSEKTALSTMFKMQNDYLENVWM